MFSFQNMQPPIIVNDVLTRSHSQLSLSVLFSLSSVCFLSILRSASWRFTTVFVDICLHHMITASAGERQVKRDRERERAQPHLRLFSQLENIFFFVCFVVSFCCCCFWKFKLRPYAIIGVIKFLFAEIKWYVSSPVICLGARSLDLISQSLSVMFLFRCQT